MHDCCFFPKKQRWQFNMSVHLISIVMPVYNAMPYLEQAIQSIYAQTIEDWELIAVDDCSTDGSREYLERIDDSRVRVFRNEKNMGHSYTCNRAISLATGKYVGKMDADDMMLPNRLEKQLDMLESNRDLDVVGCGLFRFCNDGRVVAVNRPPPDHTRIARMYTGMMSFIHGPNFKITHGAMVGRTGWFQKWKYDKNIPYAQDFDLICRSRATSTFGNVSEPLYIYRVGSGQTSSWTNQTKAVYYKFKSIMKHALRLGMMTDSVLGATTILTRPLAYAGIKMLVHSGRGISNSIADSVAMEDKRALQVGLAQIGKAKVPMKSTVV